MATVKRINKFGNVNIIPAFWFKFISFSQEPRISERGHLNIKYMFHSFLQLLLASSDIYVYLFIFIFIYTYLWRMTLEMPVQKQVALLGKSVTLFRFSTIVEK
jgi:hypothetical protein